METFFCPSCNKHKSIDQKGDTAPGKPWKCVRCLATANARIASLNASKARSVSGKRSCSTSKSPRC